MNLNVFVVLEKFKFFVFYFSKFKFSSYTDPVLNLTVSGVDTQSETIADAGGMKASYAAYRQSVQQQNRPETMLPDLDYTVDQLFWISAGQIYCAIVRPEVQIMRHNLQESHAPDRYRVIGTLSQSKDFSNDFNCAPNTKMNPANKCEIW